MSPQGELHLTPDPSMEELCVSSPVAHLPDTDSPKYTLGDLRKVREAAAECAAGPGMIEVLAETVLQKMPSGFRIGARAVLLCAMRAHTVSQSGAHQPHIHQPHIRSAQSVDQLNFSRSITKCSTSTTLIDCAQVPSGKIGCSCCIAHGYLLAHHPGRVFKQQCALGGDTHSATLRRTLENWPDRGVAESWLSL